jgi:molybdate transport system ATP-binding protein
MQPTNAAATGIDAHFSLRYPGFSLEVDLSLPASGVTVLFGHSGSGKTSLLRCIAGFETPAGGKLRFGNQTWQDGAVCVPTHLRPISCVFQESSLFPHLSAEKNLLYAVKRAKAVSKEIDFDHVIELLGISALLKKYPSALSGGERQRVAIARALLNHPQLLLMDEPLASLDQARKSEILPYLETLKNELKLPIIYVTHSADEVARLADHLVALENGRVVASGSPQEAFSRLDFPIRLGEEAGAVIEGIITERDPQWQLCCATFDGGHLWLRDTGHDIGTIVRLRVLARDISLASSRHTDTSIVNVLPAEVLEIAADQHPGMVLVRLRLGNCYVVARLTRRSAHHLTLEPGVSVWAQIKSVAII